MFDEQRYFVPGDEGQVFEWQGYRIGLMICEDLWHPEPLARLADDQLDLVLSVNASPYEIDKHDQRLSVLKQRVAEHGFPIAYLNNCGGQDELIFDGHSLVLDKQGELVAELPHCQTTLATLKLTTESLTCEAFPPYAGEDSDLRLAHVYDALVLSVRDYVNKNGPTHT